MFSKPKDNAAPISGIPAAPTAVSGKRTARGGGTAPSIISADLIVTGSLVSNGDIQIDGVVEGNVRSVGLVIGERAEIRGEVLAEDLTVRGRVIGRIRARKVQLATTSHVEGDILHEAFSVEAGAFFEGNCRHSDNPLGDEIRPQPVQVAPAAPQPGSPPAVQQHLPMHVTAMQNSPTPHLTGLAGLAPLSQSAG